MSSSSLSNMREIQLGDYDTDIRSNPYVVNDEKRCDDDDATKSMTDMGGSIEEFGTPRTPWYGTSFVLLADVMGTGFLALPFAVITLGWTTSMIAIPLFALFAAYSGFQLKAVKSFNPQFNSYSDAGRELVGPLFSSFTKICMLLNWSSLAIYYLVAAADGIEAVYDKGFLSCNLNRTIIAALLFVIPTQCRDFHTISKYLSLPSTLAIIITFLIIIVTLVESLKEEDDTNNKFAETTTIGLQPGTNIFGFLQSLSSIVFAFQGQSIFMELMSEMKNPKEFSKSCNVAYIIMGVIYVTIVIVAYGVDGENVTQFLLKGISPGVAKTTAGVLVVFHIVVAYVIAIQPFHVFVHSAIFPETLYVSSNKGRIHWLVITVGYIIIAWVIANIIPFFADLQGLIGALLGAPIVFGWPSLYYLLVNKKKTDGSWLETFRSIGLINTSISLLFLCIFTPMFCILGTWGGISDIVNDFATSGHPFHC